MKLLKTITWSDGEKQEAFLQHFSIMNKASKRQMKMEKSWENIRFS